MKTTETPTALCPACGHKIDRASSMDDATPSAGDISICIRCAAVNLFAGDLTLRRPTADELDALKRSESWPDIQRHVHALLRVKRTPAGGPQS